MNRLKNNGSLPIQVKGTPSASLAMSRQQFGDFKALKGKLNGIHRYQSGVVAASGGLIGTWPVHNRMSLLFWWKAYMRCISTTRSVTISSV